jgi:hypothetical protein
MLVPNGKVSPGLSFFRALQNLARPEPSGPAAQAQAAAKPTADPQVHATEAKRAPDHAQAARPADPGHKAAEAAESGRNYPRGSFLDIRV